MARPRSPTSPSASVNRRKAAGANPAASKSPDSEARCSIPKRNKSAISITAEATKNMLNPKNNPSNGVVPLAARSAASFAGSSVIPSEGGSSCASNSDCSLPAVAVGSSSAASGIRTTLSVPHRDPHNRAASACETNALGVVRRASQYASSASPTFSTSSKGRSQSSIEA